MKYKFKNNERVRFDNGIISGHGVVIGVASIAQSIIGAAYIVEVFESYDVILPNDEYPYTVIPMFECHIESLDKQYELT